MTNSAEDPLAKLQKMEADRSNVLKYIYDTSGGSTHELINDDDIANALEMTVQKVQDILSYLTAKELIGGPIGGASSITPKGIDAVEAALKSPDKSDNNAPGTFIINFHGAATNTQIQQGTTGSTQTGEFRSADLEAVRMFAADLLTRMDQLELPVDRREELQVDLTTLELQLNSRRPKRPVVRALLASIRGVLESASGGVAVELLKTLDSIPV